MVGAYTANALLRKTRAEQVSNQIAASSTEDFPCKLTIKIPLPTARLAKIAITCLRVDKELSPFVHRHFELLSPTPSTTTTTTTTTISPPSPSQSTPPPIHQQGAEEEGQTILQVSYSATTDRMLRVSTNGFFESLGVVLQCMEELDVDVLEAGGDGREVGVGESLVGVQGIE